jgi:hypothetical protein
MINTWSSSNNVLNQDFELYSTLEDLENGVNKWTYCNYDDDGVGFPRDCGPTGGVPSQWSPYQSDTEFSILVASGTSAGTMFCDANVPDGWADNADEIAGCQDASGCNYDADATDDHSKSHRHL